jgi:Spy/CpxP family protein refolding chaperone
MKHFVLSIALSALVAVAASTTAQAYYHHRHHHYWHHGGGSYWNYYRTSWPGRGNDEESTR